MVNCDDLYQVSCTVVDCGRNLPASKRCIRWKFGIIDEEARSSGANGMDCKGQEHEVMLLWSVFSGKRLVQQNGEQVHFSRGKKTDGKFQVQWSDEESGFEFVVIAHAAPPIRAKENWKQFDLRCNGKSFDDMVPVCSLGIDSIDSSRNSESVLNSEVSEMKSTTCRTANEPAGERNNIEEIIQTIHADAQIISETDSPLLEENPIVEEDDNVCESDEDPPSLKNKRFSHLEEEEVDDFDDEEEVDDFDDEEEIDDFDEEEGIVVVDDDDDDVSADSMTSCLFECNWDDADDDEINPNEPPSLAAIERGNVEAKKKDPLSYEQVWGKLDPKSIAKKKPLQKSPSSVKEYEGYFKPKRGRGFSPLRKIDLTNLSKKSPLGKDRSYSEV